MEDGYQYFNSMGNIVQLPLSTDSSGQPCVYWTDIESCFRGVLRIQDGDIFVPVVRGADGYRLRPHRIKYYPQTLTVVYHDRGCVRTVRERQRHNPSSPQSPTPSTCKKLSELRKKTKVATSEAASTSASSPTATSISTTTKPILSPLAAAIAAMSESSFVPATTAAWPPLLSGFSPVATSEPTVTSNPVVGFKSSSSSLPATKASGVPLVKATTVQRSDPLTAPTTTPTTTSCPESGNTGSAVTVAEETTAPETSIIPLADQKFKMPVSPTRGSKEYRFSNIEELAPEIQGPISEDVQEDEVDTTTILPLATADDKDAMGPESLSVQEPVSTSFNTPRSIGAFPASALVRSTQESKELAFIPASTQEEPSSPFARLFGLFQ
ncbi:hypothetical protein BGZ74_005388 [Mortierella antarctica]|nr:hypothetical protein BGZ74_005388 [Mortierella antarctica]